MALEAGRRMMITARRVCEHHVQAGQWLLLKQALFLLIGTCAMSSMYIKMRERAQGSLLVLDGIRREDILDEFDGDYETPGQDSNCMYHSPFKLTDPEMVAMSLCQYTLSRNRSIAVRCLNTRRLRHSVEPKLNTIRCQTSNIPKHIQHTSIIALLNTLTTLIQPLLHNITRNLLPNQLLQLL